MRDGCTLASLAKPVVVVVQEVFERAARVHAKGSGCPELAIVAYPHPPAGSDPGPEVFDALAARLYEDVVRALHQPASR